MRNIREIVSMTFDLWIEFTTNKKLYVEWVKWVQRGYEFEILDKS